MPRAAGVTRLSWYVHDGATEQNPGTNLYL